MIYFDYPPTNDLPLHLSRQEWQEPMHVIHALFDNFDLVPLRESLYRWLKKAFSTDTLPRRALISTQELRDELIRLLEAATLLEPNATTILPAGADALEPRWWRVQPYGDYVPFDYLPRALSRQQYEHPFMVLVKCRSLYTLSQWREHLLNLWSAGWTRSRWYEITDADTAHRVARHLPRLLEAAYLLDMRIPRQRPFGNLPVV